MLGFYLNLTSVKFDPDMRNEFQVSNWELQRINLKLKYGCWGQIGETNIPGFGHPVDGIDKNYQIWRRCRRFAKIYLVHVS